MRSGEVHEARPPGRRDGFVLALAAALALDQTEKWRSPATALAICGLAAAMVARGPRPALAAGLALIALVDTLRRAPDVPNHGNLTLYTLGVLAAAYAAGSIRARRLSDGGDGCFERAAPALRGGVIVVYLAAGFHKLNADFFDPRVSCAGWLAGKLGAIWLGLRPAWPAWLTLAAAALAVAWELSLAGLFAWRRGRGVAFVMAWALHGLLALCVFFDFSALMVALLWAFAPGGARWERLSWALAPRGRGLLRDPLRLSLAIQLAGAAWSGLVFAALGPERRFVAHAAQGVLFNVAVAVVAVPLARAWRGSRGESDRTGGPRPGRVLGVVAPALLALFAAGNYLGLRTAGTFSMFSNLRTEAGPSNHLIVRRPLRLAGYTDDVVWVLALEGVRARDHGDELEGAGLPRVEFEKLVRGWRLEGVGPVHARLSDGGRVYDVADVTRDPRWSKPALGWAHRLLDFRVVQGDYPRRPNACRW